MKKLPLIIVAAAAGFLFYRLRNNKKNSSLQNADWSTKPGAGNHHVTNVFSKAKGYATAGS